MRGKGNNGVHKSTENDKGSQPVSVYEVFRRSEIYMISFQPLSYIRDTLARRIPVPVVSPSLCTFNALFHDFIERAGIIDQPEPHLA
jgi:hypothetical protein